MKAHRIIAAASVLVILAIAAFLAPQISPPAHAVNPPEGAPAEVTLEGPDLVCLGDIKTYTATANEGNWGNQVKWEWTVNGGDVEDGGGVGDDYVEVKWTTPGDQSVTVNHNTYEDPNGDPLTEFNGPPETLNVTVVVDVDLDVDADYDGMITVEDDPNDPDDDDSLENTDGGLVGVGRNAPLRLDVCGEDSATVTLSWTNQGKVEITSGGTTTYSSPSTWLVSDLPLELDVKGLEVSDTLGDVQFTLKYDSFPSFLDKVKMTVAEADLDMDTDNNGTVDNTADDPDEDTAPAHVLMVNKDNDNNDDDNGDGVVDGKDRDCDDHEWDNGDDDCSQLVLRLDPDDLPSAHKVKLTVDDPSLVRVFDDSNTAILGPFVELDAAGDPGPPVTEWEKELSAISLPASDLTFRVEGVKPGEVTFTFTYYTDTGREIHSDEVVATVVDMDLDADTDNDGTIDNIADDPDEDNSPHGVFVGTNIDDDDNAGAEDRSDDESITQNDREDMEEFSIRVDQYAALSSAKLKRTSGNGKIRVFHDNNGTYDEILAPGQSEADITSILTAANGDLNLHFEGHTVGQVTYELETDFNGAIFTDQVLVHVVELHLNPWGGSSGGGGGTGPGPAYGTAAAAPPQQYASTAGSPGREGGFGGPPAGSGFEQLQEPFRLENVEFTTAQIGGATVDAVQLDLNANTSDFSASHTLIEDPNQAGLFVDENDNIAMRVENYGPGTMDDRDQFEFMVSSVAFGRAGFGECRKTPQNDFATNHVEIDMSGPRELQDDQVETFTLTVASTDGDDTGTLTETGPGTNLFANQDGSLTAEILRQHIAPQTERLDRTVRINSDALGIANRSVDAVEATPNSGRTQTAAIQSNTAATPGTGSAATGYLPIGALWIANLQVDNGEVPNGELPVVLKRLREGEAQLRLANPDLTARSLPVGLGTVLPEPVTEAGTWNVVIVQPVESGTGGGWWTTNIGMGGYGVLLAAVDTEPGDVIRVVAKKKDANDTLEDRKMPSSEVTIIKVELDIFNEHGGPQLDDADEASPGSFVLVNIDDDDGANGDDNSNNVIDGDDDKLDMAKMRINVQPSTGSGLTIQLKGSAASKVRVFNESGTAVILPETIALSRFSGGALDYYVEGVAEGSCDFTLEVKQGTSLICDPPPKVRTTVKEYHDPFNDWGAWPGGQTTAALNPTETIKSTDLGLTGNVKWAIDHGGTAGTIVSHTPSSGTEWSEVLVRYASKSADSSFTKAVEIKAYGTGADSKLAAVRRSVFMSDWSAPNTTGNVDGDNNLRFPGSSGTDTDKAEFNWDGENGATKTSAKMEGVLNFSPSSIDWASRGVSFVFSDAGGGTKWSYRLHRRRINTVVGQTMASGNRSIIKNDAGWVYDGDSDGADAQNPTVAKPDKAFRIDAPSFDAAGWRQIGFRLDLRELAEWHNGSAWDTITSTTDADWYANETSVLPGGTKGGVNSSGAGGAQVVPNTQPLANAGADQNVASGVFVTLSGVGSSDADNDVLTYKWTQTGGPGVTLSNDAAQSPTFTAPVGPAVLSFELKVSDICKGLHHHKPANFESAGDSATVTVAAP